MELSLSLSMAQLSILFASRSPIHHFSRTTSPIALNAHPFRCIGDSSALSFGRASKFPKQVVHHGITCSSQSSASASPEVIILDVRGMTCEGCAASVKRILENQPQVSSASVDLPTETAIVRPSSEAKATPNWNTELGEALAKNLTSCGFESNPRALH